MIKVIFEVNAHFGKFVLGSYKTLEEAENAIKTGCKDTVVKGMWEHKGYTHTL